MTFYEVVGEALALQVFDEVPEVHVFKDPKDYPTPRFQGDQAWFSRGENTVFVNGAGPSVANDAVFKLTHALVLNSFRRTIGGNGSIAPWTRARPRRGVLLRAADRGRRRLLGVRPPHRGVLPLPGGGRQAAGDEAPDHRGLWRLQQRD